MDAPFHNPPAAATRVGLVMAAVRSRIDARAIGRGAKLPSVRQFAQQLGVSKSTVVEAYDRLAAEGLLEARRGSGFYVATASPPLVLAGGAAQPQSRHRSARDHAQCSGVAPRDVATGGGMASRKLAAARFCRTRPARGLARTGFGEVALRSPARIGVAAKGHRGAFDGARRAARSRSDPTHGFGHARARSRGAILPVARRLRRHRRSALFQHRATAGRASRENRARALSARRSRPRGAGIRVRGTSAPAVSDCRGAA